MLRRMYDWTMSLAAHRHARWGLAGVAFIESSIFPIPPDVLLIPMVLAQRAASWALAALATVASVLGGVLGYAIGWLLFDTVGRPVLAFYGLDHSFADFQLRYNEWGAWIVFIAGVTPFPFKVITIASGVTQLNIVVFIVASILARGLRFFAVAGLLWLFGPPIMSFVEKYLGLVATLFVVLLIGGFVLARYVF